MIEKSDVRPRLADQTAPEAERLGRELKRNIAPGGPIQESENCLLPGLDLDAAERELHLAGSQAFGKVGLTRGPEGACLEDQVRQH